MIENNWLFCRTEITLSTAYCLHFAAVGAPNQNSALITVTRSGTPHGNHAAQLCCASTQPLLESRKKPYVRLPPWLGLMRFDGGHRGLQQVEGGVVIVAFFGCLLQEAKARRNVSVRRWNGAAAPRPLICRHPPSRHQWSPSPLRQCPAWPSVGFRVWPGTVVHMHTAPCTCTARAVGGCPGGVDVLVCNAGAVRLAVRELYKRSFNSCRKGKRRIKNRKTGLFQAFPRRPPKTIAESGRSTIAKTDC